MNAYFKKLALTVWSILFLFSCGKQDRASIQLEGKYLAQLQATEDQVPFFLFLQPNENSYIAEIHNGDEVLEYDEVYVSQDSITIVMGIFDAEINAAIQKDGSLRGHFVKNNLQDYRIPFFANKSTDQRFPTVDSPSFDFTGKWKTVFQDSKGESYEAIGIFEQEGNKINGTFLTKLGDYRFLEGNVDGSTFYLSAFDGSHVYYFEGNVDENETIQGVFKSGPRYQEFFTAERNEAFELPDPYALNYLKEGVEKFGFSFPDLNGNMVSLQDEAFANKVVLVQLFGTWCPNCMDETRFLADWHKKNKERGIEVIALAFESKPDFDYARDRVAKTKKRMKAEYTFLIAGESNKEKASEALPDLNQVIAFPTLIYLNREGEVRYIHTGFNGPGTGGYYHRWVEEHEQLIQELLAE